MYIENQKTLSFVGILPWHSAGYTGKNITIAVLDNFEDTILEDVTPYTSNLPSTHGLNVCKSALVPAPDADIFMLRWKGKGSSKERCIEWVKENNPDLINVSQGGIKLQAKDFEKLEGYPMFCATGNNAKDKPDYPARYDFTLAVGSWDNYMNKRSSYSNRGEDIFGLNPYIQNYYGDWWRPAGTSFACPFAVGVMACYLQYAKEQGVELTTEQKFDFAKANVNEHGLFVLPEIPQKEGEKLELRKGKIQYAVIHHSSKLSQYNAEEVLKIHKARGFATYGYNKMIEPDGKVVVGRDPKWRGAHALAKEGDPQYWNENALGYCLIWDGEAREFPDVMYVSLARELFKDGFKPGQIKLHMEVSATLCPGKHFGKGKLLKYLEKELAKLEVKTDWENHWAKSDIDSVKKLGLMAGYDEQTFKPDQPVTRAELAAVINRLYNKLK